MQHIAENPFDYAFTHWASVFKSRIREQVIGEPQAVAAPREAARSRVLAIQSLPADEQLQEAQAVIRNLER